MTLVFLWAKTVQRTHPKHGIVKAGFFLYFSRSAHKSGSAEKTGEGVWARESVILRPLPRVSFPPRRMALVK